MLVRVGQERQETRALDCRGKLPLVVRAGTRDTARDDLTGLADVLFQCPEILIVDLLNTLGSKATEFEHSSVEEELRRCQRYYLKFKATSNYSYFGISPNVHQQ